MTPLERKPLSIFTLEILTICLTLVALSLFVFIASKNPEAYGEAIVSKVERTSESTSTPKIILVGGSGLAFGIDSTLIRSELGMEPVNLGLYAGIGLDPLLALVEKSTKRGDVVVLIPEYQMLRNDPYGEGFMHLEMLQASPQMIGYLNHTSLFRALLATPNWLKTRVVSLAGRTIFSQWRNDDATLYRRVYRAENFNRYGDMVGHLIEEHRLTQAEAADSALGFIPERIEARTRTRLMHFVGEMDTRGVQVLFSWQAIPETIAKANVDAGRSIHKDVREVFGGDAIVGTQDDFTFPDDAFFDTVNHLSGPARSERTDILTRKLLLVILR